MSRRAVRPLAIVLSVLLLVLTSSGARASRGAVPSPRDVLGFEPGTDYTLADFEQLRTYFRALDAASDRVRVTSAGVSTEGREMLVAVISSEDNLERLERYKDIARRLARVRGLQPTEARALSAEGKTIVWIDNGLHASEVASAQHALVLAHRVATDESPEMREIRDNVILVLLPCINPDGLQMVADWYRKTLRTPHQDSPMPWLYQKYVGHDNNRDSYMLTQRESQVINRLLYDEWLPQIMYNQHQGTWPPRIFVPPFPDPVNPNIDPQVMRGVDLVGGAMQDRFEREGKDGVIARYQFSVWYNGSVRTTTYFHNMIGILTETGHSSPTPFDYSASDFPSTLGNGVPTLEPSVTYPHPWKGGTLRLRDAMDYMLTGSLAVLEVAAKYRERFLFGMYQVGARQIDKGRREAPVAYVVPPTQHDRGASALFLSTLMQGGVEVHVARAPFTAGGALWPAGSHVVLLAQPYRPYAKDLFEPQRYPNLRTHPGGPPIAPYDTAGWTLAYQMGVEVTPIAEPFDTSRLEAVHVPPAPAADLALANPNGRSHPMYAVAIDPRDNAAFTAVNRSLAAGLAVERLTAPLAAEGRTLPPGAWVITSKTTASVLKGHLAPALSAIESLGLRAIALKGVPAGRLVSVTPPRIGLYKSWVANIDEGWTRWLLEQYEFPYVSVTNSDVKAGGLRARFDVIVLPDQSPGGLLDGHQPGVRPSRPGPWNPPPPQYQGGLGWEGVAALKQFVHDGGTLIALDEASDFVIQRFGEPFSRVQDVTAGVPQTTFYCPGSLLRIVVDPAQPGAWGMAGEAAANFAGSRAFETSLSQARSLARYASADRLLMSGWLLGAETIAGRHAVLEVSEGAGRVVLIAFRTQFRAQPHATFKLLFNQLYASGPQ